MATSTAVIDEGVHDGLTGARVGGAQVQVCASADIQCAQPVGDGETNDAGYVSITVPTAETTSVAPMGFEGYQVVTAPGYLPTLAYWSFPISESTLFARPQVSPALFTSTETALAYSTFGDGGTAFDEDAGTVLVVVTDCRQSAASGVEVTTGDPTLHAVYQSSDGGTGSNGYAFFFNVPPSGLQVTATPLALGRSMGTFGVFVRPGAWTLLSLGPQATQ